MLLDYAEAQGVVVDHIPETCGFYVGFSLAGAENARANALAAAQIGFDAIASFADAEWEDKLSCALATLADDLDKKRELQTLLTLSKRWREVYNESTGLLRADSAYYEGTLYHYSFRLLSDMPGRIALAGGNARFVEMLDAFFGYGAPAVSQPVAPADKAYMAYGHMLHRFEGYNNEPDMETPYAYLYAGRHDRTCEVVRFGMRSMYHDGRGGLPGNDDSGGLSSCFVWNTLGLFPVSGQALVLLGSPSIDAADLLLHNGRTLSVRVHGQSEENIYVKKIIRNGKLLDRAWLSTDEFMSGGTLEFYMTADAACDRFPPVKINA
mgnify:CR=1 FL=1